MQKRWIQWFILLILTASVAAAAGKFDWFPGDIAMTGLIQSLTGGNVGWARIVTSTVSAPWNYLLLAVTAGLAWWLAGWRGAVIALISFGGLLLAEPYLKSMIARPRPSPLLIRVSGSSSGYSFPSGFGLLYFSMFGYLAVLALQRLTGRRRLSTVLACGLILVIGGSARVALGAHWPSDIAGAYLIGLTWVMLLLNLDRSVG